MPHSKNTTIINEIGKFFQKNNDNAMQWILALLKAIRMTDSGLVLHTKNNAKHKSSEKLTLLFLFSFFDVKNPYNYVQSRFSSIVKGGQKHENLFSLH